MGLQPFLNAVARWGPWILAACTIWTAAGLWRAWRSRRAVPRTRFIGSVTANVLWLGLIGLGLWSLQVRLAPLTGSLLTLQATTGKRIPEIAFRQVSDDAPHRLRELEGKVVVLNLWATYCPPCIGELRTLDRLQEAYRDRGVVVVALSDESPEQLKRFLRGRPGEAVCGYSASFDWLKIKNFRPFTLIIDRNGILRQHFFGASSFEGFEAYIRPYL